MPIADNVNPQRWSKPVILFDDGWYSLVAGVYLNHDGTTTVDRMGERWNGQDAELGFPNVSGHAVWHVVPKFLQLPILHGLIEALARNPNDQKPERTVTPGQEAATRTQRVLTEIDKRVK